MRNEIVLLVFLSGITCRGCKGPDRPAVSAGKNGEKIYHSISSEGKSLLLAEGIRIHMSAGTSVIVPAGLTPPVRELTLQGEALFTINTRTGKPLMVHTRNLMMTVTDTLNTIFKVNAFPDSSGEQVDLLQGHLRVSKAYSSTTDNDPVTLGAGEMLMINRDIDLMEKESSDTAALKLWIAAQHD